MNGMKSKGMKNKGKKLTATLLIAVFILTTLTIAIPVSAAAADVTVSIDYPYVRISGCELYTRGTGTAEWVEAIAVGHGDYSVELYAPVWHSTPDYGKIILPMEMPFEELDDFSVYVDGGDSAQALPLLEIELDIDESATSVDLSEGTISGGTVNLAAAYRVTVSSQPGQNESPRRSPTKLTDDSTGWELYGTHAGAEIDVLGSETDYTTVDTGDEYWSIQVWVTEETSSIAQYYYYDWSDIHDALDGIATVIDVRVEMVGPQDPADVASTVYIDDIKINTEIYEVELVKRTITVDNPAGNPGISSLTISIPKDAAELVPPKELQPKKFVGFIGSPATSVAGSGPWAIIAAGAPDVVILPGGAAGKLNFAFASELAEDTTGEADAYTFTISIKFEDDEIQNHEVTIYECATESITVTTDPEPDNGILTVVVGTSIDLTATTDYIVEGLPLTMKFTPSVKTPFAASITPATGTTDENGEYESTFVSTEAKAYEIFVNLGTKDALSSGGIIDVPTVDVILLPDDPSRVDVTVWKELDAINAMDDIDSTITYLEQEYVWVKAELKDKYGNSVTVSSPTTVTFSATAGTLDPPDGTPPITSDIPSDESESGTVEYKPLTVYGSSAMISAVLKYGTPEKTYSGNSKPLFTSMFDATIAITSDPIDDHVQVGEYSTITVTLTQENVPVTFSIKEVTEDYAGTLSVTSTVTDEDNIAKTRLYVDNTVEYEAQVKVTVRKPTSEEPTNTIVDYSGTIDTIAGDPALLVVETQESGTEKSIVVPEGELDVIVSLTDAYENPVDHTSDIQVNLLASAGSLSSTTIYLLAGASTDTVLFTAPSDSCEVTITATTTQAGISLGTATVTVAGPEPVLTITDPAADTTIESNVAVTRYIEGYAEISLAQPTGTAILLFKYSLDGAAEDSRSGLAGRTL